MIINDIVKPDESILLALRNGAQVERNLLIRHQMKVTADALQVHIKALNDNPTPHLMREVNGHWVRAIHYLSIAKGGPDNGPNAAGVKEGAKLAEVA